VCAIPELLTHLTCVPVVTVRLVGEKDPAFNVIVLVPGLGFGLGFGFPPGFVGLPPEHAAVRNKIV
jgi:hypothetical protein